MTIRSQCHVLIIGAGLCGLGTAIAIALEGHRVSVFESALELHQVGAGIQLTPNGVRNLRRWGIAEKFLLKAAIPDTLSIIRFDGRKLLAHRNNYAKELENRYGEHIWCVHRVDLQKELATRAISLGVEVFFDSHVCGLNLELPEITLQNGNRHQGDLVIAADGLWSPTRRCFLESLPHSPAISPQPTGDLAYRIVLTVGQVKEDAELRDVLRSGIRIWMGPGAHAVAYSLLGMLNVVLLVPDDLPPTVAKAEGNLAEMKKLFEGWDPLLKKMLSHVKKVDKWRLMSLELREPWRSEQGTFVMAGDSCHPILPYMAQGANS